MLVFGSVLFTVCSYSAELGGRVARNEADGNIPGAQVTVTRRVNGKRETVASTTTGKDGRYIFRNLQPGPYTVMATGALPEEPPCEVPAPLNRKGVIVHFIKSRTVDLTKAGRKDITFVLGCER